MKKRFLQVISTLIVTASCALGQQPATVNDTARLLAGLPVEGPLAPLTQSPAWQEYARAIDNAWGRKEHRQLQRIRAWMHENAGPYFHSTATMYYMFSGPDFVYAQTFFPDANTYILAGLEPVGQVPELTRWSPEQLAPDLAALRVSMSSILRFQYFITKEMRADLVRENIGGTLPILYVFLARTGCTVLDVTRVSSPAEGVKITFRNFAHKQPQTLFYFKTDLSGGGSAFLKWCAARGPGVSLLKAASYLMHGEGFGGVRNFLLQNSRVIVQDDSGIPLRAFPKNWRVQGFGRYVPHGDEFLKYNQPELAAMCVDNTDLGFAFGYHWQQKRGLLMLATPDGGGPARMPPVTKAMPVPQ
ncbi:MAG: hypothetical protein ACR2ID_10830 [Chthoniobacterales bacterium]